MYVCASHVFSVLKARRGLQILTLDLEMDMSSHGFLGMKLGSFGKAASTLNHEPSSSLSLNLLGTSTQVKLRFVASTQGRVSVRGSL